MDGVFTPIFVILMVSLLVECLSLLLHDFGMALCSRLIIGMLLYLAFIIKRGITIRALRRRQPRLIEFHSYIMFCVCLISGLFHSIMILLVPFRFYSLCVILLSIPVGVDEYLELQWLQSVQVLYKEQDRVRHKADPLSEEENDDDDDDNGSNIVIIAELRPSIYYRLVKPIVTGIANLFAYERREGGVV